jgi:hypothetical protein
MHGGRYSIAIFVEGGPNISWRIRSLIMATGALVVPSPDVTLGFAGKRMSVVFPGFGIQPHLNRLGH